ncbi:uncharacterized protein LOC129767565 [Toxorhynchites rutilus septentrionalis]|uniref:uncharacterized protein LOC129767565 n=1 Tax=Toxorhynchites rutilus septentrionalis TaxID=329112 RepID=UPI002479CA9C|nr:uncharacterized protein LOC129767565 [Toxorhynchites rutilus septentrionalis]
MAEKRLIEVVKRHRLLYDINDANYMKVKLKGQIWRDIAKELNLTDGEEAKTLWLKLRGSYRDARRRQLRCVKTGTAPESIKPWRFQKQMSFLESCMSAGSHEGNANVGSDEDSLSLERILNNDSTKGSKFNANIKVREESCDEDTRSSDEEYDKQPSKTRTNSDSRGSAQRPRQLREDRSRERADEKRTLHSNSSDDALHSFFVTMYQFTKTMPPEYQHRVRGQVFQVVSQAEEEIMNMGRQSPSTLSSSHQQFETVHIAESNPFDGEQ